MIDLKNKSGKPNERAGGLYFSCLIFALIVVSLATSAVGNGGDSAKYLVYSTSAIAIAAVTVLFTLYARFDIKKTFSLRLPQGKYWIYAAIAAFACFFGLSGLNGYFIEFLSECFGYEYVETVLPEASPFSIFATIVTVCVLPAIFEEAAFRGFILSSLSDVSRTVVCLIVGGLFAFYHLNPAQTLYQFAVGFVYTALAVSSGSVLPTAVLHFLNNVIIVVIYYTVGEFALVPWLDVVLTLSGVVALVVLLALLFKREKDEVKEEKKSCERNNAVITFFLYAIVGVCVCTVVWIAGLL